MGELDFAYAGMGDSARLPINSAFQPLFSADLGLKKSLTDQINTSVTEKSVFGPTIEKSALYNNPDYLGNSAVLGWDNMDSDRRDWFKSQGYNADSFNKNITGANSAYDQAHKGADWGMSGYGGVALGAGNLALGLASYFDNKDIAKKQKELLGQQIDNNREVMANSAANKAARKSEFTGKVI